MRKYATFSSVVESYKPERSHLTAAQVAVRCTRVNTLCSSFHLMDGLLNDWRLSTVITVIREISRTVGRVTRG